jgi:hypothetical protein
MMRRLLIGGAMVALLVMCLATAGLWIRSHVRVDVAHRTDMWRQGENWYWRDGSVRSERGALMLSIGGCLVSSPRFAETWSAKPGERSMRAYKPGEMGPGRPFPENLWFDFFRRVRSPPIGSYSGPEVIYVDLFSCWIPYWPIVLLTGLPPAVWLMRRRRVKRRRRAGQCVHCGYDLRETPDRCPECGQLAGERHAGVQPGVPRS